MAKDLELEKNSPDASKDNAKESKADKTSGGKEGGKPSKKESEKKSKDAKGKGAKSSKKQKKGVVKYFKDARSEFKKVVWPTPKETTRNTAVVLIVCGLAALFVFGLDSLFGLLNGLLFH